MLIMGVQNEIVGITRMTKYLFLACQNNALHDPPDMEWRPHYYGPYWDGMEGALDSIVGQRLVSAAELTNERGRTTRYSITARGRARANSLITRLDEKEISDLTALIRAHQRKPLWAFLKFIYQNYPEYTERSLLSDRILSY